MPTPAYSVLSDLILDEIQCNVAVNAPFTAAVLLRAFNQHGYQPMWELGGARRKKVASATAWTTSPTSGTTGVSVGLLTDIKEVLDVFYSTTVGSVGETAGDKPLLKRELQEVLWHRANSSGFGTYSVPKLYAITGIFAVADAGVNLFQLDVFPGVAGIYLPMHYAPMFTVLDNATLTVPDLNDIEARDAALLTAAALAPRAGRAELVPGIMAKLSDVTKLALERKASAGQEALQDRA